MTTRDITTRAAHDRLINTVAEWPGLVEQAQEIARAKNCPTGKVLIIAISNGLDEMHKRYVS